MAIDGSSLKLLRERDGWTITLFADHLGISTQYLCDIEGGRRHLKRRPDLIKRMAVSLGVPVSMLLHHEEAA